MKESQRGPVNRGRSESIQQQEITKRIQWPKRVNKNSWTQFDSDTDMVHETTLSGSGESKLEALPAIMCNMGKVDLGPMPKNDMHSLTTKQAREGDSGNNRIPEETKEKVNSSRGRRESRATRDYKTHYDSNYAA